MFESIRHHIGTSRCAYMGLVGTDEGWAIDVPALCEGLRQAEAEGEPVLLLGTAFSFVHLLDALAVRGLRFALPAGSRLMETGGYKGRSRSLSRLDLHALVTEFLGIRRDEIICEYGMSELSSQAYGREKGDGRTEKREGSEQSGVGSTIGEIVGDDVKSFTSSKRKDQRLLTSSLTPLFRFPPWARAQIVSPETGREVGEGETGLIRVFDLANVYSVMAIQTEDLALRRGRGFELIGRAVLAEPRGCSLMAV
jgi:hypothetical protein